MLNTLFFPQPMAVIGGTDSEGKHGYANLYNIIQSGFKGTVYPINPGKDKILGLSCYKNLNAVSDKIDLAVIVIPGKLALDVLETCGKRGVGSAIVISAGFRETGHEGLTAERKMADITRKYQMRVLGSNCLASITHSNASVLDSFLPVLRIKKARSVYSY